MYMYVLSHKDQSQTNIIRSEERPRGLTVGMRVRVTDRSINAGSDLHVVRDSFVSPHPWPSTCNHREEVATCTCTQCSVLYTRFHFTKGESWKITRRINTHSIRLGYMYMYMEFPQTVLGIPLQLLRQYSSSWLVRGSVENNTTLRGQMKTIELCRRMRLRIGRRRLTNHFRSCIPIARNRVAGRGLPLPHQQNLSPSASLDPILKNSCCCTPRR